MDLTVGDIVEFRDGLRFELASVSEVGEALLVETARDGTRKISPRSVSFVLPRVDAPDGDSLVGLAEGVAAVEALALEGIREAWELAAEGGGAIDAAELSDLLVGDRDPVAQLATLRAVRTNAVFFKAVGDGRYLPRDAQQVEQLTLQKAKERAARVATDAAISILRACLSDPAGAMAHRQLLFEERARHGELDRILELVEGFAVFQDDFPRRGAAHATLDQLARGGVDLEGKGGSAAFDLALRLGLIGEHENLALRRAHTPVVFGAELIAEAEDLARTALARFEARADDLDRRDWTHLRVFTVDDESTRDIDDGVHVRVLSGGRVEVGVHIADPAATVPFDSPLELEARRRGTSLYLPAVNIPMFPAVLSEGAMSLVEGEVRPALSFVAEFGADGTIAETQIHLAWIKSVARLSYVEADAALASGVGEFGEELSLLERLMTQHGRARLASGAVALRFPEVKIHVRGTVEDGHVRGLTSIEPERIVQTASRRLIQELMILVGRVAGAYCEAHKVPVAFRVQPAPSDPDDRVALAGKEHELIDAWRLRRKMPRSEFRTTAAGHFALGLDAYVQATSPIRRYGDLLCHRQLRAVLAGEPCPFGEQTQLEVIAGIELSTRSAKGVERDSTRYWTLVWLAERVGTILEGIVVGFLGRKGDRTHVFLDEVEGVQVVPVAHRVGIGDRVRVRVEASEPRRDRLVLRMVAE